MSKNSDIQSQISLNNAFKIIKNIFDKERISYEKEIKSLKDKVSDLEEALNKANKENMKYQERISKLKKRLIFISETVSKLDDSDFEFKKNKNEHKKIGFINNTRKNFNIQFRNNEKFNSFRKKSMFISNTNNPSRDNYIQFMENNFLDNNIKHFNNGEDIKTNYTNNINKKAKKSLSSIIKTNILNLEQSEGKSIDKQNNIFKSFTNGEKNLSFNLYSFVQDEKNKELSLLKNLNEGKVNDKIKFLSDDKYNQIEQKIKGIKSNLNIFKENEENKSYESHKK